MQHPRRNEVYRDVGSEKHAPDDEGFIEILEFPFAADAALLLCSDGLTDALSSDQILSFVEQNAGDRWATVWALTGAATAVGRDNVSVILVEGNGFAQSFGKHSADTKDAHLRQESAASEPGDRAATFDPPRWYRRGAGFLLGGVLLGAALTFAIGFFLLRQQAVQTIRTLTVTPAGSIGEALRVAKAGDTVNVEAGHYAETFALKEGVNLVALAPGEVFIQGGVSADDLRSARLEGFRIQGGSVGVRIKDSAVVIARDDISGMQGAGVEYSGDSGGAIFGCAIHDNSGPGITLADAASPAIENNVIVGNGKEAGALRPGLLVDSSSVRPLIAGDIFSGNGAEPIWLRVPDELILQRNSFSLGDVRVTKPDTRPKVRMLPHAGGRP